MIKIQIRKDWAWNGILHKGRDNARTPVQWDGSDNAGFSKTVPWIAVNPNYKQINVEESKKDPDSILHFYKELIAFRNGSETLKFGDFEMLHPSHEKLLIYRRGNEDGSVVVCCNFTNEHVALPQDISGTVMMQSSYSEGILAPYGYVVLSL